jgi:hypothetical protein
VPIGLGQQSNFVPRVVGRLSTLYWGLVALLLLFCWCTTANKWTAEIADIQCLGSLANYSMVRSKLTYHGKPEVGCKWWDVTGSKQSAKGGGKSGTSRYSSDVCCGRWEEENVNKLWQELFNPTYLLQRQNLWAGWPWWWHSLSSAMGKWLKCVCIRYHLVLY